MPWLYDDWNDGNWLSEMEDLVKKDLECTLRNRDKQFL